ncbi:monooxygenase [Pistricoccus aurantiacus]|uniref:Monooxygenase n=1 Tax=Pistricoccus aurantiacus TaxID=1883414 RepID=A0A5B8SRQ5_9GAMM|nr:monooxygenase [Pistricoccus aurantiacus]QEA38961.1 monooxygenase [Pistricoccus aurantiacus]
MAVILQIHFPFSGPFGDALLEEARPMAESINTEPGLRWKLWTEDAQEKRAGGIYLFDTREQAQRYLDKHSERLRQSMGVENVEAQILEVNEPLSAINRGPVQ